MYITNYKLDGETDRPGMSQNKTWLATLQSDSC